MASILAVREEREKRRDLDSRLAETQGQARKIADHFGIVRPVQLIETVSRGCDFPLGKNDDTPLTVQYVME
jgi:hypothetical protein